MVWLDYLALLLLIAVGFVLTVFTLPGLWLMALAVGGYGYLTGWDVYVGWRSFGLLLILAGIAEVVDTVGGSAGAKKAGASRRATFAATLGGVAGALVGGIFLTFAVPGLGTIVGACAGCFIGAGLVELMVRRDFGQSLRVGVGAAGGRLFGMLAKIAFAVVMALIAAIVALPIHPHHTVKMIARVPVAVTLPSTAP